MTTTSTAQTSTQIEAKIDRITSAISDGQQRVAVTAALADLADDFDAFGPLAPTHPEHAQLELPEPEPPDRHLLEQHGSLGAGAGDRDRDPRRAR
jgi:hypothetical protein